MKYDFDKIYDRKNSNSLKWDFAAESGHDPEELAMWVADMEFPTPQPVLDALHDAVSNGFFGYTVAKPEDKAIVSKWYERRHGFYPDPMSIIFTPGTVFGVTTAILAFTEPGDAVMISEPVYYPFSEAILQNGRKVVRNELILNPDGSYDLDFESFERLIDEENVRLYILCSPHNPVGRVWTEDELRRIGDICVRKNVLVIADEIHAEFVYGDKPFVSYPSLSEEIRMNTVLCTAPSKTFNTAGLQISPIFIFDPEKKLKYKRKLGSQGYAEVDKLAFEAMKAEYTLCDDWVDAVVDYIHENIVYMEEYIKTELPQLKMTHPEGTYLTWVDFSALGLSNEELEELITKKAGLWLDSGAIFGKCGEGFQRFNLACPRSVVTDCLERLKKAIDGLA